MQLGKGPPVLDPSSGFSFHTTPGQPFDLAVGGTTLAAAAFIPDDGDLDGYAIVDFEAFSEWREEDELLVGHARDPFTTVDTRRSAALVMEIAGRVVADSTRSTMLFETYLPTRYYLPRDDVRMDLLDPSTRTSVSRTRASPRTGGDHRRHGGAGHRVELPAAHNFALAVEDLLSFFNERVDITIDGQTLERPHTPWS